MAEASPTVTDSKIMWTGHAGFKMTFNYNGTEKVVYMDPWINGNPKYPACLKNEDNESPIPDDADLILVTHGHFDHAADAPAIQKASTKADCKVVAGFELANFYKLAKGVPEASVCPMGIGGTHDFGFC